MSANYRGPTRCQATGAGCPRDIPSPIARQSVSDNVANNVFRSQVRGPAVAAPGQPFTAGGLGAGPFAIRPACARRGPGVANWSHAGAHGSVGPPACAPGAPRPAGALSIARASSSHPLRPIRMTMHGGYGAVTRTRAAILGGSSAAGPETGLVGSPTRTQVSTNQPDSCCDPRVHLPSAAAVGSLGINLRRPILWPTRERERLVWVSLGVVPSRRQSRIRWPGGLWRGLAIV